MGKRGNFIRFKVAIENIFVVGLFFPLFYFLPLLNFNIRVLCFWFPFYGLIFSPCMENPKGRKRFEEIERRIKRSSSTLTCCMILKKGTRKQALYM